MSTPTSSELPVGRYLLAVPVAVLAFLALTMAQERDVFLPWLGLAAPEPAVETRTEAAARALARVNAFAAARADVQRGGTWPRGLAAPEATARLTEAAGYARRRGLAQPTALTAARVVSVEPWGGGAWRVVREETWSMTEPGGAPAGAATTRLLYELAPHEGALRIESVAPALEDPMRAHHR